MYRTNVSSWSFLKKRLGAKDHNPNIMDYAMVLVVPNPDHPHEVWENGIKRGGQRF